MTLGRTLAELNATMTSSELQGWRRYYELEPWGAWRDNFHMARLATMYHQAHTPPNKEPPGMDEFFYVDPAESAQRHKDATTLELKRMFLTEIAKSQQT